MKVVITGLSKLYANNSKGNNLMYIYFFRIFQIPKEQ